MIEYKLLFKQDTLQAAKMTFTELNMRILTEKENLFNNLAQPFLLFIFTRDYSCVCMIS